MSFFWLLVACLPVPPDRDGDGHTSVVDDCDDDDAGVFPGADERCDGRDQDCDGEVDEGVTQPLFRDEDGDGVGAEAGPGCPDDPAWSAVGGDCDDADPGTSPAATEVCGDGVDQDCGAAPACRTEGEVPPGRLVTFPFTDLQVGAVQGLPDLNGDGRGEVALGGWSSGTPRGGLLYLTADERWTGGSSVVAESGLRFDRAGAAWNGVAGLPGDPALLALTDADGTLLLFEAEDPTAPPRTLGPDPEPGDLTFGVVIRRLGDLDGDGIAEVAIGDSSGMREGVEHGRIWLLSEAALAASEDGAPFEGLGLAIQGARPYTSLGRSLGAGDIDGDGTLDLLSGAFNGNGVTNGAVYVFRMNDAPATDYDAYLRIYNGRDHEELFSSGVAAGDLDQDGDDDILIGAGGDYSGATEGALLRLDGPFTAGASLDATEADVIFAGDAPQAHLSLSMALLDHNGDAYPDVALALGSSVEPIGSYEERLLLRSGPLGADSSTSTLRPSADANTFGRSISALPDINGDGTEELLVNEGENSRALLYLGWGD